MKHAQWSFALLFLLAFLRPEVGKDKLMRDPSICQGPDGTFHMVWTSSWTDRISMPQGMSHGTAFKVDAAVVERLKEAFSE